MPKIVCVDCQTEFKPYITGVKVVETAFQDPQPYKIWNADAWACPGCGKKIVAGFGQLPSAVHYEPDFANELERAKAVEERLFYDHERPTPMKGDSDESENLAG